MRVLVTGATGFIGRHVVPCLLDRGHQVIATSTSITSAQAHSWFSQVEYHPHDINAAPARLLRKLDMRAPPDALIHLAWPGLPDYRGLFNIEENLPASYRLIRALFERGLSHCTVAGTCLEYGMQSGCLQETIDPRPTLPYAIAKDSLRQFLQQLSHNHGADIKWVRLFYLHGPGQGKTSLLAQLDQALDQGDTHFNMSGGEQLRDYLPVATAAEYISRIATQAETSGIINCCSGNPISIRRLVEQHLEHRRSSIALNLGHYPYPDYEPMAFWGDTTKLKAALSS